MSSVAAEAVHERRSGFRERLDSWTAPSGLFIAAVLVIMALPVTRTIQDPDFWWHLRAGQLIIQHGGLLGNDPFTYTVANHHWTMHEWLNEVAVRHRVRGRRPRAHRARALRRHLARSPRDHAEGAPAPPRTRCARHGHAHRRHRGVPDLGTASPDDHIRVRRADAAARRATPGASGGKAIWVLVPCSCCGATSTPGSSIGLGFIAMILVAELVGSWLHMPDPAPRERLRPLLFVLIACDSGEHDQPNGPTILLYASARRRRARSNHSSRSGSRRASTTGRCSSTARCCSSSRCWSVFNRHIRARDVALVLVTTALSLQSARHIALFVAASTPVFIDQLALATPRMRAALAASATRAGVNAARALAYSRHCSSASRRAVCSWRASGASTSRGWCRRCSCSRTHWRTRRSFPSARRSGSRARPSR